MADHLAELVADWRERARRARPLESTPLTAEKRRRIAEWMFYTNRANELEGVMAKLATAGRAVETPQDESMRVIHARRQGEADGFQKGWHACLKRVCEGDQIDELSSLVPDPPSRGDAA